MTKISALLAAAALLASASIASAATVHKAARHHYTERGSVMLLEDAPARAGFVGPASGTAAAERFQENWDVGY
jgi:hypothetical protein